MTRRKAGPGNHGELRVIGSDGQWVVVDLKEDGSVVIGVITNAYSAVAKRA
jgi:hypothetical protein